jgi:membrane-associated phospholipid phosphatase
MQFLKNSKWMLSFVLVLPVFFFSLDTTAVLWVRDLHTHNVELSAVLKYIGYFINIIAHGSTLIGTAFLLYVIGRQYNQRIYEIGRSLFIGLVSAGITVQVLKHLIGRARPRITDASLFIGPSLKSGYDSFPSGHTTLAFCLAIILSYHLPRYRALFYLFGIIVGLVRVEDLAHFPSDVLGGAIVGTIVGSILLKRMYRLQEEQHAEKQ